MRIVQQMHGELCRDSQINIAMEPQGCELLASRLDLDLRKLRRLVSEAFARAMRDKKTLAELVVPALAWPDGSALDTAVDRPAGAAKKDWLH